MPNLNIIPEVWANEMIQLLENTLPAASVCNRSMVEQINRKGDVLHIIGAGDVSVRDYPASGEITYDEVSDTDTELVINIDKYFGLNFEDSDRVQAGFDFESPYVKRGTYKVRDAIDALLMAEYANANTISYATGTTSWQFTKDTCANVPTFFTALHKQLDDLKLPRMGRYMLVHSEAIQAVSTYYFNRATALGDKVAQDGMIGNVGGFDIYLSYNCTTASSVTHGIAGVKGEGIAYAQQINPDSIEVIRREGRFANLVRGRVLAGIKTYEPDRILDIAFNETTIATS